MMVVSMPFWGRILQNMNPWRGRSVLSFICAAGYVVIAFSGSSVWLVILGQAIAGIAAGGGNLLWSLQQMYFAPKEQVAKYMGVHCTLTGARGLVAPFLGIWLMNLWDSPHAVYYVAIGGLMCAELIALQMAHREHKEARAAGHVDGGSLLMDDED
jgi:MFS family permease